MSQAVLLIKHLHENPLRCFLAWQRNVSDNKRQEEREKWVLEQASAVW